MSYDPAADLMYYAIGGALRVVGFDGNIFTGGFTELAPLIPDWTAMSYDATAGLMYYATGNALRVVGFDGTTFTSGFTELASLNPDWTAMSLVFGAEPPGNIPEPGSLFLVTMGLIGLIGMRQKVQSTS